MASRDLGCHRRLARQSLCWYEPVRLTDAAPKGR